MERSRAESPTSSFLKNMTVLRVLAVCTIGLLVAWAISSFLLPSSVKEVKPRIIFEGVVHNVDTKCINPEQETFYSDPSLSYSIEKPIKNWDKKRRIWLKNNPSRAIRARDRILIVTGSQPSPCKNPMGDHLLLRLFKNKVDYSRINGYDVFYNNALLNPQMSSCWAKISVVRAAMVAHPEVEWIWWVDSDAVFTDMDFQPPINTYERYNFVVGGSPEIVYENPRRLGLNAGVFYIRNCQWSIDFLEQWAQMGSTINDKTDPYSDDQTAMVYLLLKQKNKWGEKVLIEHEHCIQGYWEGLIGSFDNVTKNYAGLEKKDWKLKRRHAGKVNRAYSTLWDKYLNIAGYKKDAGKRPCITHFTRCQPCSGEHNSMYKSDSCEKGMERALNFADNQVLRNYGFSHAGLLNPSSSIAPI